jgi:DNA-directed RNA polymerase specialized sigma24 family protein
MTPTELAKLQQVDWKAIGIQLAGYARWKARRLRWRTGGREDLAKGKTPEDVAAEAIEKALDGTRALRFDTNSELLDRLKSIVDSDINHLAHSADNMRQSAGLQNQDGEELRDKMEFEAVHQNYNDLLSQQPNDPEEQIVKLDEQDAERRVDSLFKLLSDDKDLTDVLESILEGETKPKEIADRLNTSVSDINNRLKRIRRHADKISSAAMSQTSKREMR